MAIYVITCILFLNEVRGHSQMLPKYRLMYHLLSDIHQKKVKQLKVVLRKIIISLAHKKIIIDMTRKTLFVP